MSIDQVDFKTNDYFLTKIYMYLSLMLLKNCINVTRMKNVVKIIELNRIIDLLVRLMNVLFLNLLNKLFL